MSAAAQLSRGALRYPPPTPAAARSNHRLVNLETTVYLTQFVLKQSDGRDANMQAGWPVRSLRLDEGLLQYFQRTFA